MIVKLLRNSGWTLAGQAAPMVMALVSIPVLIRAIGDSRFGFLSIAWMLIGYFGVLDLGIGRALTHAVSKRIAHEASADISDLVGTGLGMLAILGVLAAALIAALSWWVVYAVINIQEELKPEAFRAMLILSGAVPFVLLSAGLVGILQARQQFRAVSMVQMPMGVLLFAGPLFVIQYTVALPWIIFALMLVRVANCGALLVLSSRTMRGFLSPSFKRSTLRELLNFGGWMTVTNVVSPIMVNMDRLFIGSRIAVSEVTYYVTPFEVISKLLIVPSSIAGVSFPEFSRLAKLEARDEARQYLRRSLGVVLALLAPPALAIALFAHPLLAWWVSPELADRSADIMRVLAIGIVINGASVVPFVFIQGTGRSDVTAKFHLLELAIYLPTLLLLMGRMGLMGVAIAWILRVSLDAALLFRYTWITLGHDPLMRPGTA